MGYAEGNTQGYTREDAVMEERDFNRDWGIILKTLTEDATRRLCRDGFPVNERED